MDTDVLNDDNFKNNIDGLILKYIDQKNLINDLYHTIDKQRKEKIIQFIKKDFFIDCLKSYHELDLFLNNLYELGIDCLNCDILTNFIANFIKLIRYCSNDGNIYNSSSVSDIEFFIYDLNYGTEWTKESITNKNGDYIDISTEEKLYNYLKDNFYNKVKE